MVDAWSSAPPSPQQFPYKGSDGITQVLDVIERQKRELDEMRNNLLKTAGISVEPNRVRFTGDVRIEGTLSLPAGIIDNDALANPVEFGSDWGSAGSFALPNAWTEQASCSILVPDSFTMMQFSAMATITARNDFGSTQYLMARVRSQRNGAGTIFQGVEAQATVPDLYWATALAPQIYSTGVTGGDTWRFWVESWVGGGTWTADPNHYARLELSATFSR